MSFAVTHTQDLSFDNSGNFTTAAFDTTGDTWCCLMVSAFTALPSTITVCTYNSVSILGKDFFSPATSHFAAGKLGAFPFSLGANAGSHTFNIQWSGSG